MPASNRPTPSTPPCTPSPAASQSDRGKVPDDVVQRAHDVGLTDADLLQLVAECAFASLVGTIDNLAGRVPLDEFLQPQAWKAG